MLIPKPSGNSTDVRNRTWPVCPWAEPIGTRGVFTAHAPVPELIAGIGNVRTTPGKEKEFQSERKAEMGTKVVSLCRMC